MNVQQGDNVKLGDNVIIDDYTQVLSNSIVGSNSYVGTFCKIGEVGIDYANPDYKGTIIGENALIRSNTIIYSETQIGDNFQSGHRVTIREKAKIGKNVRIGTLSDIQGDCVIGDYVNLHSNVHIGQKSIIENYVWIFPYTILTNDPTPPSNILLGITVKKFAVIAAATTILPGVIIGEDTLVGANTLVSKNVEKGTVVVGNPMKEIGNIDRMKNKLTGESVYPWRYNFDRGMPWEKIGYDEWRKSNK